MQSNSLYALPLLLLSCIHGFYYLTLAQDSEWNYYDCRSALFLPGSVFEQNLNLTLTWLAGNASLDGGFHNISVGQNLDTTIYGLVQCAGYATAKECQDCANTAARTIRGLCSNQKEGSIGFQFCSMRYSDKRFFSTTFDSAQRHSLPSQDDVTDLVVWNHQLDNLLNNLSSQAASAPSRFSGGNATYKDSGNIYAFVQCTRDLTQNNCLTCLEDVIGYIPQSCDGKVGCQIYSISCFLRYEYYNFLMSASPPELAPSPPSPNSTTAGGKKNTRKTIVTVVIPVIVSLIVAWKNWENGAALELMDSTMDGQWSRDEALNCIHIGLLCVQEAASDRPKMSEVVLMLTNFSISFPIPSRPAFFVSGVEGDSSRLVKENSGSTTEASNHDQSVNECRGTAFSVCNSTKVAPVRNQQHQCCSAAGLVRLQLARGSSSSLAVSAFGLLVSSLHLQHLPSLRVFHGVDK
ncbi:hypothetical protein FEM48_Zijuj11G0041800 [Ziziphus jujuba var. spinosa]|uniref:Gnk2-homologous domain-containing protein n=1 Tax=Ziziphus jujuba var. spinosa TaxID=714518 RepID=A0A978UGR4_ZIZJJ|nr:hypothetical protein FEM48_Zijuj11G0041800 [Ziziphus jujuba var. spinosa]